MTERHVPRVPFQVALATCALVAGVAAAGLIHARAAGAETPAGHPLERHSLVFESAGHFGGAVTGAATRGDTLILSVGRHLEVRDASDPAALVTLGRSAELPPQTVVEAVGGDAAYLVQRTRGKREPDADVLHVVDVANPAAPTWVGSLPFAPAELRSVAAVEGFVYAAGIDGLTLVDTAILAQPVVVGRVGLIDLNVVWASGDRMVAARDDSIQFYDITDRRHPVLHGDLVGEGAVALDMVGTRLYALSHSELLVIDVSAPTLVESRIDAYDGRSLSVRGGVAWIARAPCCPRDSYHLDAVDVSGSAPRRLDSQTACVRRLVSTSAATWAAAGSSGFLQVDATNGRVTALQHERHLGSPAGLVRHGNDLIVSDEDLEHWTLSALEPGKLATLGAVAITDGLWGGWRRSGPLAVAETRAFVTTWASGVIGQWLAVADISNRRRLVLHGRRPAGSAAAAGLGPPPDRSDPVPRRGARRVAGWVGLRDGR